MGSSASFVEHDGVVSLLQVKDVSYSWQDHSGSRVALRNVSAEFKSGLAHFVCGPSGAGKSTLGMILAGLISPAQGEVKLDGKNVAQRRSRIAYLFQFPEAIFFADSVGKELRDLGAGNEDFQKSAFDRVGIPLAEIMHRHPFTLSEGYARLTALAMQFARQPDVLVLDEPTIGLDWKHQERVIRALKYWLEPSRVMVAVTHDLDLLQEVQGMTWLMSNGRMEWSGETRDLLCNETLLNSYALRA